MKKIVILTLLLMISLSGCVDTKIANRTAYGYIFARTAIPKSTKA